MDPTGLPLEFLTREGCKNTPVMLANLKAAIAEEKLSADYTVIQQGTLQQDDPRGGLSDSNHSAGWERYFRFGRTSAAFPGVVLTALSGRSSVL